MEFRFREATAEDREWSARLMASMDPWRALGRRYEERLAACSRPGYVLLMVTRDGAPLGCALLHPRGAMGSPYLASIAVKEAAQGSGAGTALLRHAERYFAGARHLFLCVSSFNPRARALYEREGYKLVGELENYAMEGASEHLMVKALAS